MPTKLSKYEVESFIESANSLARRLRTMADDLDEHTSRCNVSRFLGKAAVVVGSAVGTVVAVGAAPATLGTSTAILPLMYGMLAGGVVLNVGTDIVQTVISNSSIAEAEEELNKLKSSSASNLFLDAQIHNIGCLKVRQDWDTINLQITEGILKVKCLIDNLRSRQNEEMEKEPWLVDFAEVLTQAGASKELVKGLVSTAATVVRAVDIASKVSLPLSIKELIQSSIQLYNNQGSEAGRQLRKIADTLEQRVQGVQRTLEAAA